MAKTSVKAAGEAKVRSSFRENLFWFFRYLGNALLFGFSAVFHVRDLRRNGGEYIESRDRSDGSKRGAKEVIIICAYLAGVFMIFGFLIMVILKLKP
ncbi:MAG: hypothetical protein LBS90_02255 [Oscillospiraceae bacterium]|jgi:hypothetical protein|nr:hypothetical protein [Oscillospiraceae bacterium]